MKEVFIDAKQARNVFQRMHDAMRQTTSISKTPIEDGDYSALLSDEVVSALRSALLSTGLVIFPVEIKRERSENRISGVVNHLVEVDVVYRIQNIDDPDDYVLVSSTGAGADLQDKGCNKAMTAAYKYMARQSFAISSKADDPDCVTSEQYTRNIAEKAASGEYPAAKSDRMKFSPTVDTPIEEAIEL